MPTFGGGCDIYIVDNCSSSTSNYSSFPSSYGVGDDLGGIAGNQFLAASYTFQVKELEVLQVLK